MPMAKNQMSVGDSFLLAWRTVRSNKLRTGITVAIIAFGIMALIGIITDIACVLAVMVLMCRSRRKVRRKRNPIWVNPFARKKQKCFRRITTSLQQLAFTEEVPARRNCVMKIKRPTPRLPFGVAMKIIWP